MFKNVTFYLDRSAERFPNKTAYVDSNRSVTFKELKENVTKIAASIVGKVNKGEPVVIYMDKTVECIESFLAVATVNAFYVPIDVHMPEARVKMILDVLSPKLVLVNNEENVPDLIKEYDMVNVLSCGEASSDELKAIEDRQAKCIDTDPIYAIFTSGSTGVPKGVMISQQSVLNFTEWWCETFEFTEEEVFANQTPFYFDASVKDIYATLRCAATMYIVPHKLFSQPGKLVEFLNDNKVNCIDWVPSVLCMIANFNTFDKVKPMYLKKVMFLGEVMPTKQYNIWRRALPDVKFANLYGPTEATGDCTSYKIEREFADDEPIPIGFACNNTEVMLFTEDNRLITTDNTEEIGEICVRGCSLALGYYNNPVKTEEVFVQNPLQNHYKELIYKTGDLGRYNEYGEIVFCARKDAQIKHMGHRIELGEIETAISSIDGINRVCCMYDNDASKIVAVYEGDLSTKELIAEAKKKIPQYMIPQIYHVIEEMPVNLNGKIDRVLLKETYIKKK